MDISSWATIFLFFGISRAFLFQKEVCCESIDECFQNYWFRAKPRPTCPEGPAEPKYHLWTRSHQTQPDIFTIDSVPLDNFHDSEKVYIIAHGWTNKVDYDWFQNMKAEFLKKEDVNVIIVDWSYLARQVNYPQAAADTETVGAHIAKVLNKIKAVRDNKVYAWCVGLSLGAHVCAQFGRRTHLDRITGLDPAGPTFRTDPEDKNFQLNRLDKSHADFVDVIHTDPIMGLSSVIGHVDFYPNKGYSQPMCSILNPKCSHEISIEYFIASINHRCFKAKKCHQVDDWENCEDSEQQMGYYASSAQEGIFYLETSIKYPFCLEIPNK